MKLRWYTTKYSKTVEDLVGPIMDWLSLSKTKLNLRFKILVGNMKEGDSAEERLKSHMSKYNITSGLRSQKITELWGIFRPKIESDYWFPNK